MPSAKKSDIPAADIAPSAQVTSNLPVGMMASYDTTDDVWVLSNTILSGKPDFSELLFPDVESLNAFVDLNSQYLILGNV